MGLRFFTDHCIGSAIVRSLCEAGHEVFRLRDYLPRDAPDPEVIARAQELDAILVSLNGDFSDIVTYPPEQYRGIIALQVRNHPEVIAALMERLIRYLSLQPDMEHYLRQAVVGRGPSHPSPLVAGVVHSCPCGAAYGALAASAGVDREPCHDSIP